MEIICWRVCLVELGLVDLATTWAQLTPCRVCMNSHAGSFAVSLGWWTGLACWAGLMREPITPEVGRMRALIICTCRRSTRGFLQKLVICYWQHFTHLTDRWHLSWLWQYSGVGGIVEWRVWPSPVPTLMSACPSLVRLKIFDSCFGMHWPTALGLSGMQFSCAF